MTLPYGIRLLCLCLAVFFLAEVAVAAVVTALANWALQRAEQMPARAAARLLIGLRLAPAGAGAFAVAALCAPSYLWLEPDGTVERVGVLCVLAAAAGMVLGAAGLARAIAAAARSARYLRTVENGGPVLLMAGVVRPHVVVSRSVREALPADELDAALRHERAHAAARDNLKRLLVLLAPTPVPSVSAFVALERGWRRMAEWAADDAAVAGSPERGVALASALLRVARMGPSRTPALATSLLADGGELAERVERLLRAPAAVAVERRRAAPVLAGLAATAATLPVVLPMVHGFLERLAR